ncbi:type I-E CRISPR-associated protein Cas7/Cse4/CasC [Streptomyces sp. NBC_01433]|uniref:type I-E CRISPR-associated protein Cas7/Cse4/CasC n=1 Tax=Streptomyces sp. NBC_01433 TaxID=2903864 RepID=UPI0022563F2D|nr:type I-E CRISPR-associated protein Cas7/Cse4/CasC [Streptomyces sp. NBC_01433]MCX4681568.1 type I-E CRISPR-associated protein Cas7/Cse4/CasC [Streptomyces sp. NBC_01433]
MTIHLALHALHTLPPSNVNRDELGSPKTALYGGVPRARVSSQSWKRAMRTRFSTADLIPAQDLSARTRQGIGQLATAIAERCPGLDGGQAAELAETVLTFATGASADTASARRKTTVANAPVTREILFLGLRQIDRLAELAAEGADDIAAFLKKKANATAVKDAAASRDAVDLALFGRMIATGDDLTLDASVQVAHALAVHRTPTEVDFFTAVDDLAAADDNSAGMVGQREFLSPTLYRHAVLTGPDLAANLSDYAGAMDVRQVTTAFIRVFAEAVPSGHITSYAHTTRPDVLIATVTGNPLNHVGAFETPIETEAGGHLTAAAARLAEHIMLTDTAYGDPTARSWLLTLNPHATAPLHSTATRVDSLAALADQAAAELSQRTRENTLREQV